MKSELLHVLMVSANTDGRSWRVGHQVTEQLRETGNACDQEADVCLAL